MRLGNIIEKYALENASKYNGKAVLGSVLGKVLKEMPDARKDMKKLSLLINEKIKEINSMKPEAQLKAVQEKYPELLEEKPREKKGELKELENVDPKKGVVMRFAPSPSGPMHLGHAITGGLTSLYVEKYGGKFILRIEDTNSDNIDPVAYEQLPKDAEWIFGNVSDVWVQSDRLEIYYRYIEKFISLGVVYICTCTQEAFKKFSEMKKECQCRNLSKDENEKRWKKMLANGFKEGEAVARFKSDMKHKNPAMRDFPLARINDSEHPRTGTKYRVWPLMNLSVAVDDIEAGMTHIIRAKDHADNAKRQEMMYNALGIKTPVTYFTGRYNFIGMELSCSKTKKKILEGQFSGWDDIRLPFLAALKRRGYSPLAFKRYTKEVGLSPVDKSINKDEFYKAINSFDAEIQDSKTKRFFIVREPVKAVVKGAPKRDVKVRLHPTENMGFRKFKVGEDFYLEKDDAEIVKKSGDYRLMECLNFKSKSGNLDFVSLDYESASGKGMKKFHWLPVSGKLVDVEILTPDNNSVKGLGEEALANLNVGDVIQAERIGFMRLDRREKDKLFFWFAHK